MRGTSNRGISRRAFLQGAGALTAAPLLTGFGSNALASPSPTVRHAANCHTRLVLLGTAGGPVWYPESNRVSTSTALVVEDAFYFIDLGHGATQRMVEAFNSAIFVNTAGMKVKVNAVPGTFPRVRLFWPNTVEVVLGEQHISGGNCPYHYYMQFEQSLQLLNSSGNAVTNGGQTLDICGTSSYGFGSCNFSSTNRNGSTLLFSSPLTLDSGQTYTLQAHFLDSIYGNYNCGSMATCCTQAPTLPSYVIWDVFNPTFVLVQ